MKATLAFLFLFVVVLGVTAVDDRTDRNDRNDQDDGCPKICPANYVPVCAKDAKDNKRQFSNQCQLDTHNCSSKNKYTLVSQGPC